MILDLCNWIPRGLTRFPNCSSWFLDGRIKKYFKGTRWKNRKFERKSQHTWKSGNKRICTVCFRVGTCLGVYMWVCAYMLMVHYHVCIHLRMVMCLCDFECVSMSLHLTVSECLYISTFTLVYMNMSSVSLSAYMHLLYLRKYSLLSITITLWLNYYWIHILNFHY